MLIRSLKLVSMRKSKNLFRKEDCKTGGVGGEICAEIMENAFDYLDASVVRVAARDVPGPYAQNLEAATIPNKDNIIKAVKRIM